MEIFYITDFGKPVNDAGDAGIEIDESIDLLGLDAILSQFRLGLP